MFASTYLWVFIGAVAGAIGCFVYVMRSKALSDGVRDDREFRATRRQALIAIAGVCVTVAVFGLVVSIILGDTPSVILSSVSVVIAGLLVFRLITLR